MAFTWSQVRDVIDAVLDLPPEDRSRHLDQACPEPALRRYVDSLVLSYDRAGSFLESPASVVHNPWIATAEEQSWVGRRLGPYEIIEEIGRGGMGSVYRAIRADDQYQKHVAIKVVKGGFETAFARSRFRDERQILANLEHANIARLIDGGTTESGVPYFVMELVEGLSIDQYCDSNRLPIRERLRLFRSVCSAVEYAHQNLVVHRDLKPGNILVTKDGVAKLLDFGIAKMLAEESGSRDAEPSIALLRVLTPEYASPEQITGAPVSTATDVYSLGVVLYVLLTGRGPYRVDTQRLDQMTATICRTEPSKPSITVRRSNAADDAATESLASARGAKPEKLSRLLAGDLDNIVLTALHKEPERRYASVEQFSQDLRRYLEDLPVRARKETWKYRAQKFVSRNKLSVAAFALLVISLTTGLIATLHEARVARTQQTKADRRFQDVRDLANSLMFEVHDGIATLPGSTRVRKLLVERALKYLDSLAKDARGDRSLELELATAYDKVGDIQGQPKEANIGDPQAALASYQKALALREPVAAEDPKNVAVLRDLVYSYIRLSDLLGNQGDSARALQYARNEIPTAQKISHLDPVGRQTKVFLAGTYSDQGSKEAFYGDRSAGLRTLSEGAAMFEQLLSERSEDTSIRRMLSLTYGRIGDVQRNEGSKGDADSLASFRKASAILQPLLSQQPDNAEVRRILAYDHRSIGELLDDMNQKPAALAEERVAIGSLQKLASTDRANAQLAQDIAIVEYRIGQLRVELGDARNGVGDLEKATVSLEKAAESNTPESYNGFRFLLAELWLGKAHVALASSANSSQKAAHCREAQSLFQKCLPGFESLRDKGEDYGATSAIDDIRRELSRCQAVKR